MVGAPLDPGPSMGAARAHRCPHRRGGLPRPERRHPGPRPAEAPPPRPAAGRAGTHYGSEVVGFRDGWRGLLEDRTTPLDIAAVDGLLTRGGTTLGSARVAPELLDRGLPQMKAVLAAHGIDVLIPIGGEGTLTAAHVLS